MEIDLGVGLVLGLALAAGCSDDGLANQSSGQAEASTTSGTPDEAGSEHEHATTGGVGEGTTAAGGGTAASDGPGSDSGTLGPEVHTSSDGTGAGTSTGTGDAETEGTTTGGPSQACADGCAVEFMCGTEWASVEDCVAWCEANLVKANAFSPFCRDAWEGVSACVATLTCEEFEQWQSPTEFPYPCSDADVSLSVECKGQ